MLRKWWLSICTFLKKRLKWRKRITTVRILEQYSDSRITVFRLQDSSIPGCVDLWKLERHDERTIFWLCAINAANLKGELGLPGLGNIKNCVKPSCRRLAESLIQQLQTQSQFIASHYIAVGWIEPTTINYQGHQYIDLRPVSISLVAGDFQGANSDAGDRYVLQYCRRIISSLANDNFRELSNFRSWTLAVKAINWVQFLEGLCRSPHGGISPDHTLQVIKVKE